MMELFSRKYSSWWKRLEDALKMSFVFVLRRYLQNVFNTSWPGQILLPWPYVFRRRLQKVFINTNIFVLVMCLLDVFKTSLRCLQYILERHFRRLQDASLNKKIGFVNSSSTTLQDVLQRQIFIKNSLWSYFLRNLWSW